MKTHGIWAIGVLLLGACGSSAATSGGGFGSYKTTGNSEYDASYGDTSAADDVGTDWGGGWAGSDAASSDTNWKKDLPQEQEKAYDFGAPEGSPNFVYIPAAGTDNLVKIAGSSLQVTLVEVGDRPVVAKAVPGHDAVLVINAGSDDVTYVKSGPSGDVVDFLPITPHANTLAVSPDGTSAIAFYDHDHPIPGEPAGSLQDVTLFRLGDKPEVAQLAVGFHPTSVQFRADGGQAFVVTDDGVCIIDPKKAQDGDIIPPVPLSQDPLAKALDREVQVSPDGRWAIVRQSGLQGLTAVHLPTKQFATLALNAVPTDLDVLPNGSAALAVVRETGEVAIVKLPQDPTPVLEQKTLTTGSLVAGLAQITADGKTALLYTTADGIEQAATLDFATQTIQPVLLRKTVDFALLVEGTRKAILVHKPAPGPNHSDATEAFVDDSEGITLYDLDTGYTKLVLTPVRPTGIATLANPALAWLLLPDPANVAHGVLRANLTQFQTETIGLGSAPEHARVLQSAQVVAVTQTHPSGRVTFLPVGAGEAKTVTGYELNGKAH